jgi:hypothetical protein
LNTSGALGASDAQVKSQKAKVKAQDPPSRAAGRPA